MKIKGMDFMFYNVADLKKSLVFYNGVLGLPILVEKESWAELDLGNMTLAIGVFGADTNPLAQKNSASAAFAVDDIAKAVEFLKEKGVTVTQEVMDFDPCHMALIQDPDRNEIILHQRKDGTVG
jgi:predicted enzyme related to lactoylglutathione lyase